MSEDDGKKVDECKDAFLKIGKILATMDQREQLACVSMVASATLHAARHADGRPINLVEGVKHMSEAITAGLLMGITFDSLKPGLPVVDGDGELN